MLEESAGRDKERELWCNQREGNQIMFLFLFLLFFFISSFSLSLVMSSFLSRLLLFYSFTPFNRYDRHAIPSLNIPFLYLISSSIYSRFISAIFSFSVAVSKGLWSARPGLIHDSFFFLVLFLDTNRLSNLHFVSFSFHSWNFLSSIGSGITFISFAVLILFSKHNFPRDFYRINPQS